MTATRAAQRPGTSKPEARSNSPGGLLICSQKGGVGKTTSAINLAAAATLDGAETLLLDVDPLGGVAASLGLEEHKATDGPPGCLVYRDVVPRLDVVQVGEQGAERVGEIRSELLRHKAYDQVLIDSQPYFGLRSRLLLESSQRLVVVLRAEALAYRTLPSFLKVITRAQKQEAGVSLSGILLSLPRGEEPGGRWERALREQFGPVILEPAIPHDGAIGRSLLEARPVTFTDPDSPAARAYRSLAKLLRLGN